MKPHILLAAFAACSTHAFAGLTWPSANQPDQDTLVLYHFDESGDQLLDSGPKKRNARVRNSSSLVKEPPAWMASPAGGFLSPIGEGSSSTGMAENVQVDGVDFNKGLTVSFWYRAVEGAAQAGELFQMENPRVRVALDDYGSNNNGRLQLQAPGLAAGDPAPMADFGTENAWRHVAVVYKPRNQSAKEGGTWTLLLDGTPAGSVNDPNDLSERTGFALRIGGNTFDNGPMQGGQLDEFLITNRVLTDFSAPSRGR
jgi:hypothetical protein